MPALTRGPLPARVYWVRRLLVVVIAALLVFGIAQLLGGGSDGKSGGDGAAQLAADDASPSSTSTPTRPTTTPITTPSKTPSGKPQSSKSDRPGRGKHSQSPSPTLAAPDGECDDADVAVTPEVPDPVAGRDVRIVLRLRTLEAEACTWQISRNSLTVKITSGHDDLWSSAECPRVIPVRDVVVRRAVTSSVALTWNSRRSDETCSARTKWAMPGWYHVTASALGGEPSDVQFELDTPTAATVTKTANPKQQGKHDEPDQRR
jgi:hypothetical protein